MNNTKKQERLQELEKEWDLEKNQKAISEIKSGSHSLYSWKCSICSHNWEERIHNRVYNQYGCPICRQKKIDISYYIGKECEKCGSCMRMVSSKRCLDCHKAADHVYRASKKHFDTPEKKAERMIFLTEEWHPTKNDKNITDVNLFGHYVAWWKCSKCEFEWEIRMFNRTSRNSGCPECHKVNKRGNKSPKWTGFGEISGKKWKAIKREAEKRNLEFSITIEYIWDLFLGQERTCALSGKVLVMKGNVNGKYTGNASLDRIDSTKGYIEGNVQWIASYIQPMKMNMDQTKFFERCTELANYRRSLIK